MSSAPCRKRCTLHSSFCCDDSLRWTRCRASQPRTTEEEEEEDGEVREGTIDREHCWFVVDVTFLTGDDLFMELVAAVVELVGLPVSQKHFAAAHLQTTTTVI